MTVERTRKERQNEKLLSQVFLLYGPVPGKAYEVLPGVGLSFHPVQVRPSYPVQALPSYQGAFA